MAEELMATATATEITPTHKPEQPSVTLVAFDTNTREGKKKLFNALNSAESLADCDVSTLTLDGIAIRPAQRVDDVTGEVQDCMSTIFMADGNSYFTMSSGICDSAMNLIAAFGDTFAEEPITIQFQTRKLDAKRTLKYFTVL